MTRSLGAPWWDSTLKARARDLLDRVEDDDDRALVRRWMDDPKRLAREERARVEDVILPALRLAIQGSDEQPRYRWFDPKTGEVDE